VGARAILRALVEAGSIGAASTHDVAIGDLRNEPVASGRIVNVHFEEQVQGEGMTFDYKLRPGIVTSSNALRLMRLVGIDVIPAAEVDAVSHS
jgi:DNA mismatch repair ATPase MutS